jgi:hypothetical protein
MGRVEAILAAGLAFVLALSMAACATAAKPNSIAPPAPVQPLSVPQTQVQLPPPQPLNAEAIPHPASPQPLNSAAAAVPPPPEPAAPPGAPGNVRRPPVSPPPKAEPVGPAAQPATPERAPIQQIVPADERRRLQDSAAARKRETRRLVEQAKAHRLSSAQNRVVIRIQSFIAQSDDAEKRGDMRQADALAERALILAKELADGK